MYIPSAKGSKVTVLSIDGGGIRGIIPAVVLQSLEARLTVLKRNLDPNATEARIADYFDIIAGTSTGGLVTTMLAAPIQNQKPMFATDIVRFYKDHGPQIFPKNLASDVINVFKPKYDGEHLRTTTLGLLGETKLNETLTHVVIPAYDMKLLQPVIFSTDEAKRDVSMNARLQDVCLSTSAAPTFLPPHYFETKDANNKIRKFEMIDGGIAANNPTLVALSHITKEVSGSSPNPHYKSMTRIDCNDLLVLSLGTGAAKNEGRYSVSQAKEWGALSWMVLTPQLYTPLIDFFMDANSDMVDYHVSALFQSTACETNYLRIQDETLTGDAASVDVATEDNIRTLEQKARDLLQKRASKVNLQTGRFEEISTETTNEKALQSFAEKLFEEHNLRKLNQALSTSTA